MLVYEDLFSGDKLLSASFPHAEIMHGIMWAVEGKWVKVDNHSAASGEDDDEVIDIVDTFRLKEQPPMDKPQFRAYMRKMITNLGTTLKEEDDELKLQFFSKRMKEAYMFLLSKLDDLLCFVGDSMHDDATVVFAYYKDGADDPTFLYFPHCLKEIQS